MLDRFQSVTVIGGVFIPGREFRPEGSSTFSCQLFLAAEGEGRLIWATIERAAS